MNDPKVLLAAAEREYAEADREYSARINDPEGYLPTHTRLGHLAFIEAENRYERAKERLRKARSLTEVPKP